MNVCVCVCARARMCMCVPTRACMRASMYPSTCMQIIPRSLNSKVSTVTLDTQVTVMGFPFTGNLKSRPSRCRNHSEPRIVVPGLLEWSARPSEEDPGARGSILYVCTLQPHFLWGAKSLSSFCLCACGQLLDSHSLFGQPPTTLYMRSKEPLHHPLFICACVWSVAWHPLSFCGRFPVRNAFGGGLSFLLASLARSLLFLCDYLICLGSLIV